MIDFVCTVDWKHEDAVLHVYSHEDGEIMLRKENLKGDKKGDYMYLDGAELLAAVAITHNAQGILSWTRTSTTSTSP